MENSLIKNKIICLIPFLLLFCFIVLENFFVGYAHDDLTFKGFIRQYPSLIGFCDFRYHYWTSRNLIECLIIIFLKNDLWLWRIIDALIYPLIGFFIVKLINKKITLKNSILICILIVIFYLSIKTAIKSTGFLTTSINYIWPLLSLLIHFYILKEVVPKKDSILIHIVSIICLVFACNNEQLAMVTLGVYIFGFIYAYYNKIKLPKITYFYLCIVFITIFNALICPGNYNRVNVALGFYPWYEYLNPLNKLNIGFSNILNTCITNCNLIITINLGILGVYNYIKNKNYIGFIPLIIVLIFVISGKYFPFLIDLMDSNISRIGYMPQNIYSFIVSMVVYIIFLISLIYTYILIYKSNRKLGFIIITITLISLGSSIMYGFTPTILSKERMYIFTSACSLIMDYLLLTTIMR